MSACLVLCERSEPRVIGRGTRFGPLHVVISLSVPENEPTQPGTQEPTQRVTHPDRLQQVKARATRDTREEAARRHHVREGGTGVRKTTRRENMSSDAINSRPDEH